MPISKMLNQYIATQPECRHIQFSHTGVWQDDTHTTSDFFWADPELTLLSLNKQLYMAPLPPRDTAWINRFRRAEQLTWQTIAHSQSEPWFEGTILADVTELLPHDAILFSASSLTVRHLDQFSPGNNTNFRVFANRGVSGIDGTIAAALGTAAAAPRPLALVIGDLAFYYDLNSLLAVNRCGVPATIVLINNNGGGIFHRLPIANFEPPFTELFVTPHGLDFEPAVRMFGLEYTRAASRAEFRRLFSQSIGRDTSRVIEVRTDSAQSEQMRRQMMSAVRQNLVS
jgi:2-succinyl-5-enolpyruvyl-6-hydroxy-3-cyclohexene-1-carboxylate synthase